MKNTILVALSSTVALSGLLGACGEKLGNHCSDTRECQVDSDGGTSGDADGGGAGDTGAGGTGDGDGGTGGTGGGEPDPCDACKGDTPACNADDECVECTAEDGAACGGDTPLCDTSAEECVQCLEAGDCSLETPVCDGGTCTGCGSSEDCAAYADAPVCDDSSGACVECLTEDDCGGKVCDPATNTCTDLDAGVLFACQECVHDAQCQEGQLCVQQEFDSTVVGNFCTWTRTARAPGMDFCFPDGKPFIDDAAVTSTDGVSADVCVLATTTCPAFLDHRQTITGCTDATPTSDAACGAADVDDGLCRQKAATFLCTYPCGSNEDCKTGFTCEVEGYCSL